MMAEIAKEMNPKLKGWINYYGEFCKSKLNQTLNMVNVRLARWARRKYKKLHESILAAISWVENVRKAQPKLFAHWAKCNRSG